MALSLKISRARQTRRTRFHLVLWACLWGITAPVLAKADGALPGATVEEIIALVKEVNPTIRAGVHQNAAAEARQTIAGNLADPVAQITSDEIDQPRGARQNKTIYTLQQEIPLWGKRDLKQAVAGAETETVHARTRADEAELIEKAKVAFAQYYQAHQAIRAIETAQKETDTLARLVRDRYAQGRALLRDVYKAEAEKAKIGLDILRFEADRRAAQGRLNALLARPTEAPLAPPIGVRPPPSESTLDDERLLDRARVGNPLLAATRAQVTAAREGRALAEKNSYPDITLGGSFIDRGRNGPSGYQAMIGFKIPLQSGGQSGGQRQEAAATLGAAEAQREAATLQVQGELAEMSAALRSSYRADAMIRTTLLPSTEAMLRASMAAYEENRGDFGDILRARQEVIDVHLQLIKVQFEAHRALAALERLVGNDL